MRRFLPPALLLVAGGSLAIYFGSVTNWSGFVGSALLIFLGVIGMIFVFILLGLPGVLRSLKRERWLKDSLPDAEIINFVLLTEGRRYLASLPRLDGRNGEFIPTYMSGVVRPVGIDLWAGGADPRLVYSIARDRVQSVEAGSFFAGGKRYRGIQINLIDQGGEPRAFTLTPLIPDPFRRASTAELQTVRDRIVDQLGQSVNE